MRLLTWNIQCGLGCDGMVDLSRIAEVARSMGEPDVLCFQEVSQGFRPAAEVADQVAELAGLFPGYRPVFGPAVEAAGPGGRMRAFGNLVLSRFPVLRVERHLLPWPANEAVRSMRRQAVSILVETPFGALGVVTTHLEYHSHGQRAAQVLRLREIAREAETRDARSGDDRSDDPYRAAPPAVGLVLAGDFNVDPEDELYTELRGPQSVSGSLVDAWRIAHPERDHDPTCGIFDRAQWPQGPHCRDFVWLTTSLSERLIRMEVDVKSAASDHQPLMIELR